MSTFIALLRGINVSGKNKIPMADLRSHIVSAGFEDVRTYVQSGNLLVSCKGGSVARVRDEVHQVIESEFGFHIPVMVRTPKQWRSVVAGNPYLAEGIDTKRLYVAFLDRKSKPTDAAKLDTIKLGPDGYSLAGSEIYLDLPSGAGRTKLTNAAIEKKLGVVATTRNWRTVGQIDSML